jgi:nucleoid DNA-binding protein
MLNSLLKSLTSSNSVTLPSFGGIMKMGSSYMFNEFLKFNDGKFSKFLQETDGLSKEEANAKIEDFIKEIKTALSTTGSFSLNEIGTLNLIDGKIKLEKPSYTAKKEEDILIVADVTEEKVQKKEIKKKEIEVQTPKEKQTKKTADNLSINFPVKEAQEKIKALKDKQEIIFFTRGDNRKSIIEALNQKLKSLNNIDNTELDILEASQIKPDKNKDVRNTPIKEGSEKEVKEQVAKESDILKIVIEKEIEDNTILAKELVIVPTPKKVIQTEITTPSIKKKDIENTETKEEEDLVALTEGAAKIEKEAKRRKRNKFIFWFALICILSGVSIIGYLKQDFIVGWFENSEQLAHKESSDEADNSDVTENTNEEVVALKEEVEQIIEPEIIPEEIENLGDDNQTLNSLEEKETAVKETIIEPEELVHVESTNKLSYYAVIGSFSKDKNAENLAKSLKEEGYNDAMIFQNGNLKSVSLGIFSTSSEAKKVLKQSGRNGLVKKAK